MQQWVMVRVCGGKMNCLYCIIRVLELIELKQHVLYCVLHTPLLLYTIELCCEFCQNSTMSTFRKFTKVSFEHIMACVLMGYVLELKIVIKELYGLCQKSTHFVS